MGKTHSNSVPSQKLILGDYKVLPLLILHLKEDLKIASLSMAMKYLITLTLFLTSPWRPGYKLSNTVDAIPLLEDVQELNAQKEHEDVLIKSQAGHLGGQNVPKVSNMVPLSDRVLSAQYPNPYPPSGLPRNHNGPVFVQNRGNMENYFGNAPYRKSQPPELPYPRPPNVNSTRFNQCKDQNPWDICNKCGCVNGCYERGCTQEGCPSGPKFENKICNLQIDNCGDGLKCKDINDGCKNDVGRCVKDSIKLRCAPWACGWLCSCSPWGK